MSPGPGTATHQSPWFDQNKQEGKKMPCHGKKHTPIVSGKQERFFKAEYSRKKKGKKGRTGMSKTVLRRHIMERERNKAKGLY